MRIALIGLLLRAGFRSISLCEGDPAARARALGTFAGLVGLLVNLAFIEVMTWAFIWYQIAMVVLAYHFASRLEPSNQSGA